LVVLVVGNPSTNTTNDNYQSIYISLGELTTMNKTKKVAWHKHLAKAKKLEEKRQAQKTSGTPTPSTARR
jgi:hypothetical protein